MEDRLYKFARLVDAGSYTKAAKLMHISQPALTMAVKKLERELHAELLIRDNHTFRLTAAGAAAYETAKALSVQANNLKLRLAEAAEYKVNLNLGMIDSLADLLFVHNDNLPELEQSTHLSLTVDNTTRLLRYVEHDELDIALVARQPVIPAALATIDLGCEPLVLVAHIEQTKQIKRELATKELHRFLSYNLNSRTQTLVASHFTKHDIELYPSFYSTSPEIMLQLVLAKRGAAVLPYLLVRRHLAQHNLAAIAIGDSSVVSRSIIGIHRVGRSLPAQAIKLLDKTSTLLGQLGTEADS
ncbi:MAG TPA: LysR family transcriptional regulator [Patescibacteria group bacterium]|nr:LysR family transcriptional regulator [Patescibacteria group bacterium]